MRANILGPPLDLAATINYFFALGLHRKFANLPAQRRGLVAAVQFQRLHGLHNMAKRENRLLIAVVVGCLG